MKNEIKILSLNVCGLLRRSQYPEFIDMINNFDILCLLETKTDDIDNIDLPGFISIMKNRFKFRRAKSGGIVLAYKQYFEGFIIDLNTESLYIKWFEVDKRICRYDENLLFGIVYIPPESSIYCIGDPYGEVENEYLRLCTNHKYVCILGDFNARISNEPDFIPENEVENEELILEILESNYTSNVFDKHNISKERTSKDRRKNNFGNQLLHLCKYNDLLVCNGRVGDDKHVGNFTCKNSSVVDYIVCSTRLLEYVENFEVLEFSNLFSDAHCRLALTLSCQLTYSNVSEKNDNTFNAFEKIESWDSDKNRLFTNNIDCNRVSELINSFDENNGDLDINKLVEETSNILLNAAKSTFGTKMYRKHTQNTKQTKENKPWFDDNCKKSRKLFRRWKGLYADVIEMNISLTNIKIPKGHTRKLWMKVLRHTEFH